MPVHQTCEIREGRGGFAVVSLTVDDGEQSETTSMVLSLEQLAAETLCGDCPIAILQAATEYFADRETSRASATYTE